VENACAIRDALLVSTALQTEARAFESLYRLHRPLVYSYALARLRDVDDAEDATQTTFLKAYHALHHGARPRDTGGWVVGIAKNVCRDRFREAKRRPRPELLDETAPAVEPSELLFNLQDVCREISMLSPRYRTIITMREFEGRSFAEIAASLGYTEAAVQSHLVRARRTLRERLELAITCEQARRIALRDLNGVSLLEDRRAMQKHVRRCAECATFIGRRPRTHVAQGLWLATMPFRRLAGLLAGGSAAPVGSTAGGAGALAAKLVVIGVMGTGAVGVSVKEFETASTPAHTRPTPAVHRSTGQLRTYVTRSSTGYHAPAVRIAFVRERPHSVRTSPPVSKSTLPVSAPTSSYLWAPSPQTGASTPATSPAAEQPGASQPDPAQSSDSGSADTQTATPAAPASSDTSTPDASSSAATQPDASTPDAVSTTTTPAASPAATPAPSPDESASTTTPSSPASTPGHGDGNGSANGIGSGGAPPGRAKPDVAHPRP
jgi:RNA polymerase sigma-70 factor (ECF subfamily)